MILLYLEEWLPPSLTPPSPPIIISCFVVRTFKIYSLSNFQACNRVFFGTITALCHGDLMTSETYSVVAGSLTVHLSYAVIVRVVSNWASGIVRVATNNILRKPYTKVLCSISFDKNWIILPVTFNQIKYIKPSFSRSQWFLQPRSRLGVCVSHGRNTFVNTFPF